MKEFARGNTLDTPTPNPATLRALDDVMAGRNVKRYTDLPELIEDTGRPQLSATHEPRVDK
jgi:hypothetical protein